jgi:NAD(P)-dependent dehydrogenase (short-subunit alcohol dehydrogenase family)
MFEQRAIVTGAGRGIGRAVALALGDAGYQVALIADISSPDEATDACAAALRALGGCDVLVNSAGVTAEPGPFAECDVEEWWRVFDVNVRGTALVTRAVLPAMLAQGGGYVINVNSLQASEVEGAPIAYGASKAALMRFTDALNAEVEAAGVRVFDVSPGLVRTTMTSGRPDLDALPEEAWSPAELTAELVLRLVDGAADGLAGRLVRVTDDLDELLHDAGDDPDFRRLRLVRNARVSP